MSEAQGRYEIGRLYTGEFRDFLGRLRLQDQSLRWHEGRGLLSRRFDIVGKRITVEAVEEAVARLRRLNSDWA